MGGQLLSRLVRCLAPIVGHPRSRLVLYHTPQLGWPIYPTTNTRALFGSLGRCTSWMLLGLDNSSQPHGLR